MNMARTKLEPIWVMLRRIHPRFFASLPSKFPLLTDLLRERKRLKDGRKGKEKKRGNKEKGKKKEEEEEIKEIALKVFPSEDPSKMKVKRLGCAMTNQVYVCHLSPKEEETEKEVKEPMFQMEQVKREEEGEEKNKEKKILIRVYGEGTEVFFAREREMKIFRKISEKGFGPKLLHTFEKGRVEEFVEGRNLSPSLLRDPLVSSKIAHNLSHLHLLFPRASQSECEIWNRLHDWLKMARKFAPSLKKRFPSLSLPFTLDELQAELVFLRQHLEKNVESPVVFCHNDAQYGNILMKDDGSLILIDYEYAGYNYRGFDLGNHFCEWASDYDSSTPHLLNFDRYPSLQEQFVFLKAYLLNQARIQNVSLSPQELLVEAEKLQREAAHYGMISDLKWTIWGVIQGGQSSIDFNFIDYAVQRWNHYLHSKASLLS